MKKEIDKQNFISICNSVKTMSEACNKLNLSFSTFRRYAKKFNCYMPNQGGRGINKKPSNPPTPLDEILKGHYPQTQSNKLKLKLFESGIKEIKCEECGLGSIWNNKPITLELHHKNGKRTDHRLENLKILCPNCHTQTENFGAKNIKKKYKKI